MACATIRKRFAAIAFPVKLACRERSSCLGLLPGEEAAGEYDWKPVRGIYYAEINSKSLSRAGHEMDDGMMATISPKLRR